MHVEMLCTCLFRAYELICLLNVKSHKRVDNASSFYIERTTVYADSSQQSMEQILFFVAVPLSGCMVSRESPHCVQISY
jgi:hypothetical protein